MNKHDIALQRFPTLLKQIQLPALLEHLDSWCGKRKGPPDSVLLRNEMRAQIILLLASVPRSELEDAVAENLSAVLMDLLKETVKNGKWFAKKPTPGKSPPSEPSQRA